MEYKEVFNGCKVVKKLGSGSFGSVYLIEKNGLKSVCKYIVVPNDKEYKEYKRNRRSEEEIISFFESGVRDIMNEVKILHSLTSVNGVVGYQDHQIEKLNGRAGWEILIKMEYLTPLDDYKDNNGITIGQVIKLGIDLSTALHACYLKSILHRDIKEDNILVDEFDNFKLTDFGISKNLENVTRASTFAGTSYYMAPEVGKEKYNYKADMYSLGMVLYKLLNNMNIPFMTLNGTYNDMQNAIDMISKGKPFPKPTYGSEELFRIIKNACAYKASDRYNLFTEMKVELEKLFVNENNRYLNTYCIKPLGVEDEFKEVNILETVSVDSKDELLKMRNADTVLIANQLLIKEELIEDNNRNNSEELNGVGNTIEKEEKSIYEISKVESVDELFEEGLKSYNRKEYKDAAKYYEKAANIGHVAAINNLAYMYYNGEGIEMNKEKAVHYFLQAATKGVVKAQYNLGLMYDNGVGVAKDLTQAHYWYQKAADGGDQDAVKKIYDFVSEKFDFYKDYKQGLYSFSEVYEFTMKYNDPKAQIWLGFMYAYGDGVEKDYVEAIEWFKKAAEQGDSIAQFFLDNICNDEVVEKDNKIEDQNNIYTTEEGFSGPPFLIACAYYEGKIVERDYKKALKWFIKAAEEGNSEAQYMIGNMYCFEEGVEQDYEETVKWYEKAAKQGHSDAQFMLGNMYYVGGGVEQDYKKAKEWYRKAADQGNKMAKLRLCIMYFKNG